MTNKNTIQSIKEMLDNAEANIRSANQLLISLSNNGSNSTEIVDNHNEVTQVSSSFSASEVVENGNRIIEGKFDGQNMIGPDKKSYPVPANYASKSKLVPGDILKLTVMPDGSFIYKQIGPVPRKRIIGSLCYEDGAYMVIAEGKSYSVLLASITYFKAEIGDKVALIIPELEDAAWGAIENVVEAKDLNDDGTLNVNLDVKPL